MTDTNQASELYELCEKVYELTGWNNQELLGGWIQDQFDGPENRGTFTTRDQIETILFKLICPLYTSDYLLERLPDTIGLYREELTPDKWLAACEDGISYGGKHVDCGDDECGCESYYGESDTPLKALLKLCLVLKEAGELK